MGAHQYRQPRWKIADVLARTDLQRLLDELAQPANHATRGRRWHCPVPGHEDRHASVGTHTDHHGHERWRCWSGDKTHRGDAIDLVMITQRVSRTDAIDWLANRAGMIADQPLPPVRRKRRPTAARNVPLRPAVFQYARACAQALWTPAGQPVLDWLHSRGFDDPVLSANRVGADLGPQITPRASGLPKGELVAATFPAFDETDQLHYLQARYLELSGPGKYDNPAGRLGSNPRLAWTRTTTRPRRDTLIICEGMPDALTAAQAGYSAVAILGNQAPNARVARRIATYATNRDLQLVGIVHNDDGGAIWRDYLTDLLEQQHCHLATVVPTIGNDLNEWAQRDSSWTQTIEVLGHGTGLPVPSQDFAL